MTDCTCASAEIAADCGVHGWSGVTRRIVAHMWRLMPDDYQRFAHKDLTFSTNMQDLIECVEEGLDDYLTEVLIPWDEAQGRARKDETSGS